MTPPAILTATLCLTFLLSSCKCHPVQFIPETQFSVQGAQQQTPNRVKQFVFEPEPEVRFEEMPSSGTTTAEFGEKLIEEPTTPCPDEELASEEDKIELNELKNVDKGSNAAEEATTPCPEELALKLLEENKEAMNKESDEKGTEKVDEETTTPCPEELALKLLEENKEAFIKKAMNEQSEESVKKDTEKVDEQTTPCPEEAQKAAEQSLINDNNKEATEKLVEDTSTLCPEELALKLLEEKKEAFIKKAMNEENELVKKDTEKVDETTTPCPEEESQKLAEQTLTNDNKIEATEPVVEDTTTPCPDKVIEEDTHTEVPEVETQKPDPTTPCPNETPITDLSVKSLLQVQKNSPLLKLIQQKHAISKRQVPQQYYAQKTYSGKPQKSYPSVRTYQQQLQRQYQNFYPNKGYVSKPAAGYRYRTKTVQNRRQGNSRPSSSTTVRTTRTAFKKKFRPSPVFP